MTKSRISISVVGSTTFKNSWLTLAGLGRPYSSLSHVLYPYLDQLLERLFRPFADFAVMIKEASKNASVDLTEGLEPDPARSFGAVRSFGVSDLSSSHFLYTDDSTCPSHAIDNFDNSLHLDDTGSTESRSEIDIGLQTTEPVAVSALPTPPTTSTMNVDHFDADFDFDFMEFENAFPDSNNYLQFDDDMLGLEYLTSISEPFPFNSAL